jgi:pyruvate/2-oxoglutarate/acetoin dehydrogenase E1 component
VLFLEPKHLYHGPREEYCVAPDEDYVVPLGSASIRRSGSDATVVTWGNCVYECLAAAAIVAEEDGAEVEVIDLRSIVPMDEETVIASLARTNRLMVVHEDTRSCGFGAEVVARIVGRPETFGLLDAPVARVTKPDVLVPYSPTLERIALPHARCDQPFPGGQPHDPSIPHDTNIVTELRKLLDY